MSQMEAALLQLYQTSATNDLCEILDSIQTLPKEERITILQAIVDLLIREKDYESCSDVYVELLSISDSYIYWIEYIHFLKCFSTLDKIKEAFRLGVQSCDSPHMLYEVYCRSLRLYNDKSVSSVVEEYQSLLQSACKKRKYTEYGNSPIKKVFDKQSNLNKTIIVKNYDLRDGDNHFRSYFEKFGKIVNLHKHDGETIFIEYSENAAVGRVREIKHVFDGVPLYIQIPHGARDRTLYLSGFSTRTTEASIKEYLSQFGTVEEIRLKTNFESQTAFAYVDMYSSVEAKKACAIPDFSVGKDSIHVTLSDPKKARNRDQIATDKERTCCVKNIPFWVNESNKQTLQNLFSPFGSVMQIRFLSKHRGMAFVEFENKESAQSLINNMSDIKLGGRILKIEGINK
eukprot:NODE_819_length_3938_cov_0.505600.p2 type:complete len:401 gc:universal NODE_819_length_3938_cov_0.505600:3717-2515(-)